MSSIKDLKRHRRHHRIRARVSGSPQKPRFFVFKSNKHIYGGLADDISGRTLLYISNAQDKKNDIASAHKVGEEVAKQAQKSGIKKVVFDRSGYRYHGRVKALAEGARIAGLQF